MSCIGADQWGLWKHCYTNRNESNEMKQWITIVELSRSMLAILSERIYWPANYPRPQVISRLYHKWTQDQKWSPDCTTNEPRTRNDPQIVPQMNPDQKWSPDCTTNEPRTRNEPQIVPQMNPGPEMIPRLYHKWTQTRNDPQIVPQMNPGPEMNPRLYHKWTQDQKWFPDCPKNIFQDHW